MLKCENLLRAHNYPAWRANTNEATFNQWETKDNKIMASSFYPMDRQFWDVFHKALQKIPAGSSISCLQQWPNQLYILLSAFLLPYFIPLVPTLVSWDESPNKLPSCKPFSSSAFNDLRLRHSMKKYNDSENMCGRVCLCVCLCVCGCTYTQGNPT